MARVHTRKANKDYPELGIAKGDTYFKWSLRPSGRGKGATYRSKTYPTRQQLTSSDFMRSIYNAEDTLAALTADESLAEAVASIISDLEELRDEQQEKLDNMGDGLSQGATGQLIQERYDALETWIEELQGVEFPDRDSYAPEPQEGEEEPDADDYTGTAEEWEEAIQAALEEAQAAAYPG